MISNTRPVKRSVYLYFITKGVLNRLAFEVFVGISGTCESIPTQPSIQRPASVDVGFAEVGIALWVRLGATLNGSSRSTRASRQPRLSCF